MKLDSIYILSSIDEREWIASIFTETCSFKGDFSTFDMEGGLLIIDVECKIFPNKQLLKGRVKYC